MVRTHRLHLMIVCLWFWLTAPALAGGPVHGAKAAGMGTAFVAVADDPSCITHNPAGLSQLKGLSLYNGGTVIILNSDYKSPAGGSETTQFQVFLAPHAYLAAALGREGLAFGLGIYSPFGIGGRKWCEGGLTRYAGTEGTMGTVSLNPTISWRVFPQCSLALGVDLLYAFNRLARMASQAGLGFRDAKLSFKGEGLGFGYNLGLLLFPEGKISFGFAYRSGIRVKQKGTFALENIAPGLQPVFGGSPFRTGANMVANFPEIFSWGLAWRPSRNVTLALDLEWTRWSSFNRTKLDLAHELPAGQLTDMPLIFDWKDSLIAKIGIEYQVNQRLAVRAGYCFVESPVPDHTLSPGNPEAHQHNASLGLGFKGTRWWADVFYNAAFYQDRTVSNEILRGKYQSFCHYSGISLGYRF